jgi:predicted nucleotidyltransferase
VDLRDPTSAVTATLDGPVLAVLATAGKPLTAGEVAAQMPRGSEVGVRRSLARLVEQGTVRATEMGRNRVHELNRDHVAAPIAVLLSGLRLEVWRRIRVKLGTWKVRPLYACIFGSAARGDGDADSDLDLLLIHAPFPGDVDPRRRSPALGRQLAGVASEWLTVQLTAKETVRWRRQVDELHDEVRSWTGNPLQTVQMSSYEWADHKRRRSSLYAEISRDAIQVGGETGEALAAILKASG